MNRLELLQETLDIIDPSYIVCEGLQVGLENEFFAQNEYLNIPLDIKAWKKDIETSINIYTLLDYGFDFTGICRYETFVFFHEIGHLINGMIENELIYLARIAQLSQDPISKIKEYIKIPDEWWAWQWAWDFISSNKEYVKKLDSQLQW